MNTEASDRSIDQALLEQVAADLRRELEEIRRQQRELRRQHQRALLLRSIYGGDALTRERFAELRAAIDQYPGRLAELVEEERLLTGWLERAQRLRVERPAEVAEGLPAR